MGEPCRGRAQISAQCRAGFTLVELLIAAALLSALLMVGVFAMMGSMRAQRAIEEQVALTNEMGSVFQIISYEVALAGYTGTAVERAMPAGSFSVDVLLHDSADPDGSDSLTIRYFEDQTFLASSDSGARSITYLVAGETGTLERVAVLGATTERQDMVLGVVSFQVVEFVGRDRIPVAASAVQADSSVLPEDIAGIRISVRFVSGDAWTFLVGLHNRQTVRVCPCI